MNNLIFFNKEGYPHNFQYNKDTESYNGKIIFDENSDQTFRTQSLHIFENVEPIDFIIEAEMISMKYNNNSGLTINGTNQNNNQLLEITNIVKVNDSVDFFTKWIYGVDFHKKFTIGSMISFSGVTGTTYTNDFNDEQYFFVLSTKKNAILIMTDTSNSVFNFECISGHINSLCSISINEYNRNFSDDLLFQNLYTDKKISIINSEYNDGIVNIKKSGITYSYLTEFELNGAKDQIFTLRVDLHTEKPKVLQGDVTLKNTGISSGTLTLGKYSYLLAPEDYYSEGVKTSLKKNIIFEDISGNKLFSGYTFTINSLITENVLGTKELTFKKYVDETNKYKNNSRINNKTQWNTIQYNGQLDINIGDIILLTKNNKTTSTSSTTNTQQTTTTTTSTPKYLMNNRELNIIDVKYNNTKNITILFVSGYIINEDKTTYKITKKLKPNQVKNVNFSCNGNIQNFNNTTLKNANCYLTTNDFSFSQTYTSGTTNNISYNTINTFINKYKTTLYQYGIDVYYTNRNNIDYLSIESLYGTKQKYFSVSGYTNGNIITENFDMSYSGTSKKYDIITTENLKYEKTNKSDSNLYKTNAYSEIYLNLNSDNDRFGFKLTLNSNEYSTDFSIDTQTTINKFISTYENIMKNNGFIINSGYSINNSGYTLNITSDIDIWDLGVIVNILSTYKITENQRNNAILLSANEIRTNTNLFDLNLSTGMILKINGSNYDVNNKEYNIISLSNNILGLSYQGVLNTDVGVYLHGSTREFIRKPRGEYDRDVYFKVYWETPYLDEIDDSIFLYDISGNQLIPYNNIEELRYIGKTPLINTADNNIIFLNKDKNKDINKINTPKYQQTVFDELIFKLEQLDSSTDFDWVPEPLEIFIGYNSSMEGVNTRTLKIERIDTPLNESRYFSFSGYTNSGSSISLNNFIMNGDTIQYSSFHDFNFLNYGFEKDQIITLNFKDQSTNNQRIFENNNIYKLLDVSRNKLTIDTGYTYTKTYTDYSGETEYMYIYDDSGLTYFTTTGKTFYFNIEVQPKEIFSCIFYGQTEIEDIRFKVNLNNLGVQSEKDVYEILYESDVEDDAIDYTILNSKRKEMLLEYREIYDYIGSYKALINSINYFGYNDLKLFEYYKNIDKSSTLYNKLHKVLIPDIFDNKIEGWNEIDFIKGKYQNQDTWRKTNLFNLAYNITDEDGNNVLIYSLDEIQYKLTKLKKWLRKNVIPISTNLQDITGVSDTTNILYQEYDESNQVKKSVVERSTTVVNFNYTATLNFGSDYLVTVNFYILTGNENSNSKIEIPESFSAKIKTYYLSGTTIENPTQILIPVQYYKLNKNDLTSFSFTLNKNVDPYIYIETTTYSNDGSGVGYVNNKMFYFDEPRNYWLVNNNFDLTKMIYSQTEEYIRNETQQNTVQDSIINSMKTTTTQTTYTTQTTTDFVP